MGKSIISISIGYKKSGKIQERWIDSVKRDLHQRGSNVQQAAECVKYRVLAHYSAGPLFRKSAIWVMLGLGVRVRIAYVRNSRPSQ